MKRRFTYLLTALALLAFLSPTTAWGWVKLADTQRITQKATHETMLAAPDGGEGIRADQTVTWTATSGALGAGIGSGTISTGSYTWNYTRTLVSGSSYTGWTSSCIQLGKNGGVENLTLSTSNIPGTIKSVSIECSSYQGKHNVSISVGNTTYLESTATPSWTTIGTKTGTGTASGQITISFTSGTRALYIKSLTVVYEESSTEPSISVTPSSINWNDSPINEQLSQEITVSQANLTGNITASTTIGQITWNTQNESATLTYTPTETGDFSGTVTFANGETTAEVEVTGSAYDPADIPTYELVTSVDNLQAGDVIIFGCASKDVVAGSISSTGKFLDKVDATISENVVTTNQASQFTLGGSIGNWTLSFADNSLLGCSGGDLAKGNENATNTWSISISNGSANITATVGNNSYTIKYNSSSPRFKTYASGQTSIEIYKLVNENQVATPTFTPVAGTYYAAQNVSIACATDGAAIQYKTTENGEWQSYTAAISVNETTTIWAKASKEGMDDSQVASATYTITLPMVETPTFSPEAGTYTSAQNVSITCETSGATIYYTTDGTTPTAESTQYTDAIAVAANTTIKAIAVKEGMNDSEVATAEYTILNIVHAGTEADPYTVADARTAIDANIGVDNVYATGIVSEIVTAYNSQYGNISYNISADGETTSDQLEVFRGKSYNGENFTSADDIQVGDIVVVYGDLTKFNSTYEFAANNQLVSLVRPQSTEPAVTLQDYSIDVPAAGGDGILTVNYENIEEILADIAFYEADGETEATYDWITAYLDSDKNINYSVEANDGEARTAYLKVYAHDDNGGDVYSNLITITQEKFVVDYATLPFSYDGNGTGTLPAGFTVEGLSTYSSSPKMQFNTTGDYAILKINERPGELGFDIKGNSFSGGTFKVQTSTDGETYTDLATYTALESTTQHQTFNNLDADVRYIKWIYTTKSSGNVGLGNITLAKYTAPQPYDLTIATSNDVTIIATNENITGSITNGGTAPVYSGSLVTLDVRPAADYVLDEILVTDADNGTHSVVPLENGLWGFYMPSNNVTVSAVMVASHSPVTYTLATSVEPGRHYIIVGENSGVYYAMGAQKPNNRAAKQISIDGITATVTRSDVFEFTIAEVGEGVYSIQDDNDEGYLAAGSSSSNYLVTNTELTTDGQWTIEIDATTGEATVIAQGSYTRNYMQFNHTSILFSCYGASNNQHPVYLYVKNDRFQLDINGYTGTNDNYYLIASPVTVDPSTIDMTTGDFDLYAFDQAEDKEWRNWKGDENLNYTGHFNLVPGQGYLYAKKATEETSTYSFTLTGDLYTGNGKFQLVDGWNLLGNPYAYATQLDVTDYAVMNDAHDAIIPADDEELENPYPAIQRLQGVFVWGEAGSIVTFSPVETNTGAKHAGIVLNLTKNRGSVADRAIVRFGEGQQMPKFQLNENTPKLYIPQGGNAFSVVRSGNENEMPVNFEAEANGTYTLNVEVNALEVNYLHLIDNMTGADIDLLATPSYTFSAKTTDYASRFRLVFNASGVNEDGASTSSAAFAFYNGSSWTVSNLGEATLQVVDVMGRVLSSETISGNTEVSLNQPAGIYMLRLVNGTDVKVQKIVVR